MKPPSRTPPATERRTAIQPDVAAALRDASNREKNKRRTPAQRVKAKRDEKRNRVTYDLPKCLQIAVEKIAIREKTTKTGAARILLATAARMVEEQDLTFRDLVKLSWSPLHEYVVDEETVAEILSGSKRMECR